MEYVERWVTEAYADKGIEWTLPKLNKIM